jgi:hypothetical protein
MAEHPADHELVDMGDAEIDREDYRLAPPASSPPPEVRLPYEVRHAIEKAEEAIDQKANEPEPLKPYQFTIRDMLILTTVVALLTGLVVSVARGASVALMYLIFALLMVAAWFARGLWEAGYWRKRKPIADESPSDDFEVTPVITRRGEQRPYSAVSLLLMFAIFAFLMSLSTFLPGQNKLSNVAGMSGLCSLVGLVWLAFNESRHPLFIMFWWLMFLMYLISSIAVVAMG